MTVAARTAVIISVRFICVFFCLIFVGCGVSKPSGLSVGPVVVSTKGNRVFGVDEMPAVYRDYGVLYLSEGEWEREAQIKPWSAWWYPLRDPSLFLARGTEMSPLQKYDAYARAVHQYNARSADYERDKIFDPHAERWEGLCHAWSMASLLFPEPLEAITKGGITFSSNDQKALLIKSFEQYVPTYYGGSLGSIQPHVFHRFIVAEMIEKGRPFIVNKVSRGEVWNLPVWKVLTTVVKDSGDTSIFHARTAIVAAAMWESPEQNSGTTTEVNWYSYDMFSKLDSAGNSVAIGGRWTGLSTDIHPGAVVVVPEKPITHQSRNVELRNDWIDEIVASGARQFLGVLFQ